MQDRKLKAAVYSGSFNPLHIGHQAILEYLTGHRLPATSIPQPEQASLSTCPIFDRVYLIVSPQSPFKDAGNNLTARDRFDAAVAAVARHPHLSNVIVDDIELTMDPPQYTIRTLDALKAREPGTDFTLVIGADNLAAFTKWKDYRRILTDYGIVVFPRTGFDSAALKSSLLSEPDGHNYKITLMSDAPLVDISSTEIRQGLLPDPSSYLM